MRLNNKAFAMPVLLITISFLTLTGTYFLAQIMTSVNLAYGEQYRLNAQLAADAGLDAGIHEINQDETWTGLPETTFFTSTNFRTTHTIEVDSTTAAPDIQIKAIGRTYSPATASTPKTTRSLQITLKEVTSGNGVSSVVTGIGGLVLNNNAKITGGDVVVNGTITMGNNSQIGLSSTALANAVNIRVAHTNCPTPPDATFPQPCATGENGEPINLDGNARIYADVRATNQVDGTNMSNPGLVPNQTVAPTVIPGYDRTTHPVNQTSPSTAAGVRCTNNGNIIWPAGLKIVGDVDMMNNCTITVMGDVWITGHLKTGNNGEIIIADANGLTTPTIMVDGQDGIELENNGVVTPNINGTGAHFRTFWSTAACSPDCADVTGVDLFNSKDALTIDLGNNGEASNSIFTAQWTKVEVSNNGALGAVAGQTIVLGNNAIINFTASVPASSNLVSTWVKRGYLRVF